MNGATPRRKDLRVREIFTSPVLEYALSIVYPWPPDKPLNAPEVGQKLFKHSRPTPDWDDPNVKTALVRLSEVGIDKISQRLDQFPEWVRDAGDDEDELSAPDRNMGMILILDQGAKHVCKGVNARYAYEVFERIPIHSVRYITDRGMASLKDWEAAGMDKDQAIIRVIIMLGTLVHSEDPANHDAHLRLAEAMRKEYEHLTRTHDPYRQTLAQDLQDIDLYGRLLSEGPPEDRSVHISDVVYWMMRFYTSHIAFLRHFGRSPFRNVAVGRMDTDEELQWLKQLGISRTNEDADVREMIRQDIDNGRWRPLEL